MPARAHPHPRRSAGPTAARPRASPLTGQTRLPWWAVVLPALAFAMLLGLLLGGGQAHAAEQQAARQSLSRVLERVEQALLG